MARTITPDVDDTQEIETIKCDTHKVILVDGVCPRCEYIARREKLPDAIQEMIELQGLLKTEPTQRTRRCPVETEEETGTIPESTRRTKMPDDKEYVMKTRCHWPCPCGGTVPDVPATCKYRKYVDRANTYCVDAQLCTRCDQRVVCGALERHGRMISKRRKEDEVKSRQVKKED